MELFKELGGKLGFGLMRLPKLEDESFDIEQIKKMVDLFMEAGMNYFDTAYVYPGSEEVTKEVLINRYPRDTFFLTTKLNAGAWAAKSAEEAKKELEISLERTGAGYFDCYLLHALGKGNIEYYDSYGIWDFVKEAKEKGLIKHYGFSFHDDAEFLDELLTKHPDVELVQLQTNYADWNNPSVQSKACYEVCVKHNKKVIVMEPVKGGTLANPPEVITKLFKDYDSEASVASWAIRYVASLDNTFVVLSGMSNIEQMKDNLSYMKDFRKLNEEEEAIIQQAQDYLENIPQIPCTGCKYCTKGCPMKINIPSIFSAMNKEMIYSDVEGSKNGYAFATRDAGKASECIHCLQCEDACPQHIEITSWLEKAAEKYD